METDLRYFAGKRDILLIICCRECGKVASRMIPKSLDYTIGWMVAPVTKREKTRGGKVFEKRG